MRVSLFSCCSTSQAADLVVPVGWSFVRDRLRWGKHAEKLETIDTLDETSLQEYVDYLTERNDQSAFLAFVETNGSGADFVQIALFSQRCIKAIRSPDFLNHLVEYVCREHHSAAWYVMYAVLSHKGEGARSQWMQLFKIHAPGQLFCAPMPESFTFTEEDAAFFLNARRAYFHDLAMSPAYEHGQIIYGTLLQAHRRCSPAQYAILWWELKKNYPEKLEGAKQAAWEHIPSAYRLALIGEKK